MGGRKVRIPQKDTNNHTNTPTTHKTKKYQRIQTRTLNLTPHREVIKLNQYTHKILKTKKTLIHINTDQKPIILINPNKSQPRQTQQIHIPHKETPKTH